MTYKIMEQSSEFSETTYYVEDLREEFWSLSDAYAAILKNEGVTVEVGYV